MEPKGPAVFFDQLVSTSKASAVRREAVRNLEPGTVHPIGSNGTIVYLPT